VPAVIWLSSSSAEITRARTVLKALAPGGVIDELGFLVLNGAFADRFYPAVTTPMTRARYFFFVPAIYQYLERSGKGVGRDVDRLARDLQYDLLKRVDSELGAIGKESGRAIVRPPSEIYWSALAVLGLAKQRTSLALYQRRLSEGVFRAQTVRDDDEAVHPEDVESLWDPALRLSHVLPGGVFPDGTTLRLRRTEAAFLRDRYASLRPDGHHTLITHMVTLARERGLASLDGISLPWDIPGLPEGTAQIVDHARRLSLFARGATLQYYRLLIEKKGEEDAGANTAFIAWWEAAHEKLQTWDQEGFFTLLRKWDADRRPIYDRAFLGKWIARCVAARSGEEALRDADARAAIAERENRVRPGKQRLQVKYQLESWRPPRDYGAGHFYQLQYRHPVGLQFAEDIVDGLERGAS
jgi:hypothetical protein